MRFYQSKEFKELADIWRERLNESGFTDIEDKNENLKDHDKRTIAFQNSDRICEYFLSLDSLMTHYPEMPAFEKRVMNLYSRGKYIWQIVKETRSTDKTVRNVIKRYKGLILAVNRLYANAEFPQLLNPQSKSGSEAEDEQNKSEDQAA